MFKSSFSFLLALAVLIFVAAFAATIRNGGEPSDGEKLNVANESIAELSAQNEEMRDKIQYFSGQLEILADRQKEVAGLEIEQREELKEVVATQRTQLSKIEKHQSEIRRDLELLRSEQKEFGARAGEKLKALAERFDFGDARMREIADAQEDFAALGEKIRQSTVFKKLATVDLDEIGRALSKRIEVAMKNSETGSTERNKKLILLKERRSQLNRLTKKEGSVSTPEAGDSKEKVLDEAEQVLATNYKNEIAKLEKEIEKPKAKDPSPEDHYHTILALVLAKAEEEYGVVFTHRESEDPIIDLTSQVTRMIRELPEDDPILSDLKPAQ